MPRQIVVFALAVILVACAKEAEKPVDTVDSTTVSAPSSGIEFPEEELSPEDSLARRMSGIKDSIQRELMAVVYPNPKVPDYTGIGVEGDSITWSPDNIHFVKRASDTLVLATFERHHGDSFGAHAQPGYMDLVAASLKNGKFSIIDTCNDIALGSWGVMPPMLDYTVAPSIQPFDCEVIAGSGFVRLGRDAWGWITNSTWSGQGHYEHFVSVYGLINRKIRNLGSFQAAQDNMGAYDSVYHTYNSSVYVADELHPTVSDIAIVWYHTFSGIDSTRQMTLHRYRPGKGYDFAALPFKKCRHSTKYCMKSYE